MLEGLFSNSKSSLFELTKAISDAEKNAEKNKVTPISIQRFVMEFEHYRELSHFVEANHRLIQLHIILHSH